MKLNTDKYHVLLNSHGSNTIKIENLCIKNSSYEKMLSINFDYKLKFTNHIDEISKKASWKSNALAKIPPYMGIRKRRTLVNAFFKSQFNYCRLIWMCCNQSLNNNIGRLHERSLRIVYSDKTQISVNYLKKMVLSLFTTKISDNLQLKCSRYQKVCVLKLWKDCFNLEMTYLTT